MSDWQPPTTLPDLRGALIAIDTETCDRRLGRDLGSGWPFADGYVCGVSVAYRVDGDVRAHYFPLAHPDTENLDPARVHDWLRDLITGGTRFITQNGIYDWGWLGTAGVPMPPSEQLEEIGALATLVDENRKRYSLDALCEWRGIPGKDTSGLQAGAATLGLGKKDKPAAQIWRMPARFVGPYAEHDARATLLLYESLRPVLDAEGTHEAYRLEVDLLPMVHAMRKRGVRVDTGAAERARDLLIGKRDAVLAELTNKLGVNVTMAELNRGRWLATTFDAQGIKYPRTKKGNPSFTAGISGWMHKHEHWLPQAVAKADRYNKAAVDFLEGHILRHVVNGRVHAEIHPHRSDEGGTRSLRFSYSNPPLQQMAARDPEIAPLIRGCFLPEKGEIWCKPDISQQEFRFIVHYAQLLKLPRAQEAAERYRTDPDTDFHALVADMTGLPRDQAKATNFAKAFGAGPRKFAAMIGKPENEARAIYERYDAQLPFVKALSKICERTAAERGFLLLYDNARRHWTNFVAPVAWAEGAGPCDHAEALRRINDPAHPWFGRTKLSRVDTHKAMNALIQGSAARHTKLWMRACWREGITPLLQLHDCLDLSVVSPEVAERVAQLGCEAVKLEVPMKVDLAYGHTWADAKHAWADLTNVNGHSVGAAGIDCAPPVHRSAPPQAEGAGGPEMKKDGNYPAGERQWGTNIAEYIYQDEHGNPYLKVVRTSTKQFPQFHHVSGYWLKGKPAGPKIPYRLPELIAAATDAPIWICEGEKDADNVAALGYVATTNSEGAGKGKWTPDLNKWFAGKHVAYVLEDNDADGKRHVQEVAAQLKDIVPDIHIVPFTDLKEHGDVSDFLAAGGTKEQLLERAQSAPKWEPPKYRLHWHGEVDPLDTRPSLIELVLPETGTGLISGQWGTFKTFVAIDLAASVMAGKPFINFPTIRKGGVLFIALEGQSEINIRIEAAARAREIEGNAPFVWTDECPRLLDADAGKILADIIRQASGEMENKFGVPLVLVIIDTLSKAAGYAKAGDENDAVLAKIVEGAMATAAKLTGAFVMGITHFGKDPSTGTRGSSGREGDTDVVLALLGDKAQSGAVSDMRLCLRKRRSGPNGEEFPFAVRVRDMGEDAKGTPQSTLTIDWAVAPPASRELKDRKLSRPLRCLRAAMMKLVAEHGTDTTLPSGEVVRAIGVETVRPEFYASYPIAEGDQKQRQATRQKAFKRALDDGLETGLIGMREVGDTSFIWFAGGTAGAI